MAVRTYFLLAEVYTSTDVQTSFLSDRWSHKF